MRHLLIIVCNHLWALAPMVFSCSTSTSSMLAVLLYLSAAIPFMYYSTLNADTKEGIPSTVGSTGRFGFVLLFLSHWRAANQRRRVCRGWVVGYLPDSLPCLATVLSQISRLLLFIPFLFLHCIDQHCSSLQCTFAKRVAWIMSFVCLCFIETLRILREPRYLVWYTSSWNVSSGHHT